MHRQLVEFEQSLEEIARPANGPVTREFGRAKPVHVISCQPEIPIRCDHVSILLSIRPTTGVREVVFAVHFDDDDFGPRSEIALGSPYGTSAEHLCLFRGQSSDPNRATPQGAAQAATVWRP